MDKIPHYRLKQISTQLLTADLERSVTFYIKRLGFEVDFWYEDFYCGIIKDGYSIHLKLCPPSSGERKNKREDEHTDLLFSVDDIEDLYKQLKDNQIEIIQPLRDMPYGKEFYIADPDGYIIAFVE